MRDATAFLKSFRPAAGPALPVALAASVARGLSVVVSAWILSGILDDAAFHGADLDALARRIEELIALTLLRAVLGWIADRAGFVACDHAAALSDRFDLIVSNPPYIRSAEIAGLDAEVRDHDPRAALDGGADGLEAYRALIPQAGLLLAPFGVLVVEAGHDQSSDIEGLMAAAGLTLERPARADLAGILRAVAGRKLPR